MAKRSEILQGTEKEFMEVFKQLCYSRSSWQVWADVMSAIACSLSNAVDKTPGRYEAREKEYEQCIKRLGSVELPAKIMGIIVMALENNPEQDFLGEMYMRLELGNHWKGQFFTSYCVCQCMAEISIGPGIETEIKGKGYLSINDPACGAGATLIAAANTFHAFYIFDIRGKYKPLLAKFDCTKDSADAAFTVFQNVEKKVRNQNTNQFFAPEVLKANMGIGVDWEKADIYSLAKLILFILTGHIIEDTDYIDEINGLDDELKLVLMEMLDDEPQNRPEISNLLNSL